MGIPVEKDEQIKEVQHILETLDSDSIQVLKGYIKYGDIA